jgi:hypothetical protein
VPDCFAVVSGSYSDYQVHVVFEIEEDAKAYAAQMSRSDLKRTHDRIVAGRQRVLTSAFGHSDPPKHQGEFDTCEWCIGILENRTGYGTHPYDVERFDYWPAGTLASNREKAAE